MGQLDRSEAHGKAWSYTGEHNTRRENTNTHTHIYIYIYICVCNEWHSNPRSRCSKNMKTVRAVTGEATAVVGLHLLVACILITTKLDKGTWTYDKNVHCSCYTAKKNSWILLTENKIFVNVLKLSPRRKVSLSIKWIQECLSSLSVTTTKSTFEYLIKVLEHFPQQIYVRKCHHTQ
jgi:hypothetical protein